MPKIFDLYNSLIYVEVDKIIDKYLKDVNVTCVVPFDSVDDVEKSKEIAKERLIKKYARCENVLLMHIMQELKNNVKEVDKRVTHRLVKNLKKLEK